MRIQQDAIPGREIPMWFTPIETLETFVVCGQLCGEGHGNMVGTMEVVPAEDYRFMVQGPDRCRAEGEQEVSGRVAGL